MTAPIGEWRAQLHLALPLIAQQLGFQLMGTVDAALLGHHDRTALAASGIGNNLLFAFVCLGMGFVMGMDSVVPQAVGAGRPADARRYLAAGVRLATLVGIGCSLAVLASPWLLEATDVPPEVIAEVWTYIQIRSIGVLPYMISIALRSYLAANHVTRPLIVAVVVGNMANALLDLVLIFGVESIGLPPLGIVGAGLATVVVQIAIAFVYAGSVRVLDGARGIAPAPPTRADVRELARHGAPVGGQLFLEVGIFGVATLIAGHLGELPAAAHTIALNLASFTFAIAVGIGNATNVRVGHAIGAGDRVLARRRGLHGIGVGFAVMSVTAAVFLTVPDLIAQLFTTEPAVIAATVPLLQIAAVFQLSDGAQAISAGALRAIGESRATFIGNLIGHYGIGLGLSLSLAFAAGLGAPGLWWGLSAGLTGTALYLVARFLHATRTTP
jgi:multidrug resistance protein, MATE family